MSLLTSAKFTLICVHSIEQRKESNNLTSKKQIQKSQNNSTIIMFRHRPLPNPKEGKLDHTEASSRAVKRTMPSDRPLPNPCEDKLDQAKVCPRNCSDANFPFQIPHHSRQNILLNFPLPEKSTQSTSPRTLLLNKSIELTYLQSGKIASGPRQLFQIQNVKTTPESEPYLNEAFAPKLSIPVQPKCKQVGSYFLESDFCHSKNDENFSQDNENFNHVSAPKPEQDSSVDDPYLNESKHNKVSLQNQHYLNYFAAPQPDQGSSLYEPKTAQDFSPNNSYLKKLKLRPVLSNNDPYLNETKTDPHDYSLAYESDNPIVETSLCKKTQQVQSHPNQSSCEVQHQQNGKQGYKVFF